MTTSTYYTPQRALTCCTVAALIFSLALSFTLCDSTTASLTVCSCAVAYIIACIVYNKSNFADDSGRLVLLFAATILASFIILNVHTYVTYPDYSSSSPWLVNHDAKRHFSQSLGLYDGTLSIKNIPHPSLPLITAGLWKLLGVNIIYPLAANMLFTLLAIILGGRLAATLLHDKIHAMTASRISTVAMLLNTAVCNFMVHGSLLLRESVIYFSLTLVMLSLCNLFTDKGMKPIFTFLAGTVLLVFSRSHLLFFVLAGIMTFLIRKPSRNIKIAIIALLIVCSCYIANELITGYDSKYISPTDIMTNGQVMSDNYLNLNRHNAYKNIIGNYYDKSPLSRAFMLPVTAAVQFFIPFPWNFMRDISFGFSQFFSHISYPWYAIGGIIIFYYLFLWHKRGTPLRLWALWVLICYLVPAYLYAGSVSRYVLPFVPFMIPLAIYSLHYIKKHKPKRLVSTYAIVYCLLVGGTLFTCYILQS